MDLESTAKKFKLGGDDLSEDHLLLKNHTADPGEDSKINTRFMTDYDEKTVIGEGSFGKVYRCIKKLGHKEVAVKETYRKVKGYNKMRVAAEAKAMA